MWACSRLDPGVGADRELAVGAWPGGGASATRRRAGLVRRKTSTSSMPPYQLASGGIDQATSSVSIETTRVDVAAAHRLHVLLDDLPHAGVAERAQGDLLAALGQALVDGLAGPLQGAVDRGDGGVERLAHLLGGEAEHLAQDQDRALARRQVLHRGDEGELDRLALLVGGVGRGVAVLDLERLVGVGLDPDLLGDRLARRLVADRPSARTPPAAAAACGGRSGRGRRWWRSW